METFKFICYGCLGMLFFVFIAYLIIKMFLYFLIVEIERLVNKNSYKFKKEQNNEKTKK